MTVLFAAVHMAAIGTSLHSPRHTILVAFGEQRTSAGVGLGQLGRH
jgi:hypothetical protein